MFLILKEYEWVGSGGGRGYFIVLCTWNPPTNYHLYSQNQCCYYLPNNKSIHFHPPTPFLPPPLHYSITPFSYHQGIRCNQSMSVVITHNIFEKTTKKLWGGSLWCTWAAACDARDSAECSSMEQATCTEFTSDVAAFGRRWSGWWFTDLIN